MPRTSCCIGGSTASPTRHPGNPSENPLDGVITGDPDDRPDAAPGAQPHDALFRQIFGDRRTLFAAS